MSFDIAIFYTYVQFAVMLVLMLILMLFFKRIFFLETNTAKQRKIIRYFLICIIVSLIVFTILFSFGISNFILALSAFIFLVLAPFTIIYSSVTGRKRAKWLGIFTIFPLLGFFDSITLVLTAPSSIGLISPKYEAQYTIVSYSVLTCVILLMNRKKPKFIRRLEENIENRMLTVPEEIGLWGVGLWLFAFEFLSPMVFSKMSPAFNVYIALSNMIVATAIVMLIVDSNYRQYYYKRNMALQKSLITTMADLVENRDENTGGHIQRTAKYVEIIARRLKSEKKFADILTDQYIEDMVIAAPLHDVGKIHISDAILNKPGRLDDSEFNIMKTHAAAGSEIISRVEKGIGGIEYLIIAEEMAEYHHEWMNGKGYPHGISGDEIPLCAKILAVADVFDALVSKRCYKEPFPLDKAFAIIEEEKGSHFDTDVVDAFFESRPQIEQFIEEIS